jgi:hypothetical protein
MHDPHPGREGRMAIIGDRNRRAADEADETGAFDLRMRGPRGLTVAAAPPPPPRNPPVFLRRRPADNPGTLAPGPRPPYPLGRAARDGDPGDGILVGVALLPALAMVVWALLSLPSLDDLLPATGSVATAPVIREPGG